MEACIYLSSGYSEYLRNQDQLFKLEVYPCNVEMQSCGYILQDRCHDSMFRYLSIYILKMESYCVLLKPSKLAKKKNPFQKSL